MVRERPLHRKNAILLAAMIQRGYTLRSLAKAAGVHYLTIWRLVNRAHNPGVATARRLAELLETPAERLGLRPWGTGTPPPPAPEAPGKPTRRVRRASAAQPDQPPQPSPPPA